jgi:putative molybdopterin biosynthesis protein
MAASVRNRLAEVRKARGLSASEVARRVGVGRQTVYAIESGDYAPNTETALRLARLLDVPVEDLFFLDPEPAGPVGLEAELLATRAAVTRQPVRLCRVGERWIAVPSVVEPLYLPEADGVAESPRATGRCSVHSAAGEEGFLGNRILVAGCDPAIGLLAQMVERSGGADVVAASASSRRALQWLKKGRIHIAGSHLEDPRTGDFNLPYVEREFAAGEVSVITFARWEEGIAVAKGNPHQVRSADDLARKGIAFINRETGAGSRALLDKLLKSRGIAPNQVSGYDRIARGHLDAAGAVAGGTADCCIATRSAAMAFDLDFIPLREERYDFVIRKESLALPAVQVFLDTLQHAALRRKLELLAGYDTRETGARLV